MFALEIILAVAVVFALCLALLATLYGAVVAFENRRRFWYALDRFLCTERVATR